MSVPEWWSKKRMLLFVVSASFLFRLAAGVIFYFRGAPSLGVEPGNWWDTGYSEYGLFARNLVEGKGYIAEGQRASRPPLYPLLLAAEYRLFGKNSVVPIFVQSVIGAGTVFFAYLIAAFFFGRGAGLVAAVLCAIYPYYVAHDTAQQESALLTFLTAGAVYFFLRAGSSKSIGVAALAGAWLGLAALCKESLLAFAPPAFLWLALFSNRNEDRGSLFKTAAAILAMALVLSPWLIRNTHLYGRPVMTTGEGNGFGYQLWIGFNESTLAYYPWDTIDKSIGQAGRALPAAELEKVRKRGDLETDAWFLHRALRFIQEHPLTALKYSAVKILAAFSPIISPLERSFPRRFFYTISYTPVFALAVVGGVMARHRWRTLLLIYFLILSFAATAAVGHAHSSHRSILDVELMALASYAITVCFSKKSNGT